MVALFILSEQLINLRTTEKILTWKIGGEISTKVVATLLASVHENRRITGITHRQNFGSELKTFNHEIANDATC